MQVVGYVGCWVCGWSDVWIVRCLGGEGSGYAWVGMWIGVCGLVGWICCMCVGGMVVGWLDGWEGEGVWGGMMDGTKDLWGWVDGCVWVVKWMGGRVYGWMGGFVDRFGRVDVSLFYLY